MAETDQRAERIMSELKTERTNIWANIGACRVPEHMPPSIDSAVLSRRSVALPMPGVEWDAPAPATGAPPYAIVHDASLAGQRSAASR